MGGTVWRAKPSSSSFPRRTKNGAAAQPERRCLLLADYHLSATLITRGEGRSAVAASAYRSCSRMYNDYDGVQHDYTRKGGLAYEAVMLPPQASTEWKDREKLWNAVEAAEKSKDSRLAREFNGALPVELDKEQWIPMLREFVQREFVDRGMCADLVIHTAKKHNPHFHLMFTVRPLDEKGKWQAKTQKEYLCARNGEERGFTADEFKTAQAEGWEKQYQYKVGKKKVYMVPSAGEPQGLERASKYPKSTKYGRQNPISERWNSEEQLREWRKAWEVAVNQALEKAGRLERVDCRSFKERGIDEQPTIHEGPPARAIEAQGGFSERCEMNRIIRMDNRELRSLKDEVERLRRAIRDAAQRVVEKVRSVLEIAQTLEKLRWDLIGFRYDRQFNAEQRGKQREILDDLKPLREKYAANIKFGQKKVKERDRLKKELASLNPFQFMRKRELERQIANINGALQGALEEQQDLLFQMGCQSRKDVPLVDHRLAQVQENMAKIDRANEDFDAAIESTAEEYHNEKAAIPAELRDAVRQERSYLRQEQRVPFLRRLQEDRKNYSFERYQEAERFVDRKLKEQEIRPQERPEVVEQRKHEQEAHRAERKNRRYEQSL